MHISKLTQPTFTCSKSTMETLEQYVKSVQTLQERHQNDVNDVVVSLLLTFTHCSGVFIVDFEQVSASWEHTNTPYILEEHASDW